MTKSSFLVQLLLWFLTLASYLGETSAKIGPVGDLVIANVDVSPDGYTRMAALAGGTIDGELIVGQKGDDFVINVINNLNDSSIVQSTSIHWHGLFQRGTSTVVVIGCPISHNNSLYKFNAGDQAGTFGITHTYYYEGLLRPMIIYDSLDPHVGFYDVDDENAIVTLSDWNHVLTKTLKEPTSDTTLINGLDGADIQNYWIRANLNVGEAGYNNGINSAILRYSAADNAELKSSVSSGVLPLNETDLVPLENLGAPGFPEQGGVDYSLTLNMLYLDDVNRFTINGASFHPPPIPVLLQILSGAQAADKLLPAGSVYTLPPNSTIELSVLGTSVGHGHAFHLHGSFDVVRSAGSSTYNYENPVRSYVSSCLKWLRKQVLKVRRDVVRIGDIGANDVTIRFKTDNVGPWSLLASTLSFSVLRLLNPVTLIGTSTSTRTSSIYDLCSPGGLAVVFAEDSEDWATTSRPPSASECENICLTYDALPASEL
ncbi:Cupredoxin [Armillaria solidipes]|uniref:Cupredoxin n=1 Tax=Armillaria solidipes TaxID=1076256 RepID=A0A2H3BQZ4_9AGAR|nr:Cupredoxin [Armillaria solidipes]